MGVLDSDVGEGSVMAEWRVEYTKPSVDATF